MKLLAHASSGIIHIIAMYYFYRCFFTQYKLKKELVIGIYILNGIYGIVYPMFTETVLQNSICTSIYFLIPLCICHGKRSAKLVLFTTYWVILCFSEYLVYAILMGIVGDFAVFYQNYEYHYSIGVMLSSGMTFVLLYIFGTSVNLLRSKYPIYLLLIMLLIPISLTGVLYYLQQIVQMVNLQSAYNAYCYITFILLLLNLFVVFTISRIAQTGELKAKLAYEAQQRRDQHNYHKNLAVYHQKVRQLSHDMHNHLLILHNALREKQYDTAEQYVEKQLTMLSDSKTSYTGYLMLDTILDYKQQLARTKQIGMQVRSMLSPDLPLGEELMQDVCMMLGSCLDNALEATEQIEDAAQRTITVLIKYDAFYLSCRIENTVAMPVQIAEHGLPRTTKRDSQWHGLGLENVKRLAEKYDGYLMVESTDALFISSFVVKYR